MKFLLLSTLLLLWSAIVVTFGAVAATAVTIGPTTTSLPETGVTFTGSDGVTVCRACSIDCEAWGFFTRCKSRYFNYGCHIATACLRESEASVNEIQAATVMCAIWNGCQYASDNIWQRPEQYLSTTKSYSKGYQDKSVYDLVLVDTIGRQDGIDFIQLQNNLRRIVLAKVFQVHARDYVLYKMQQNLRDLFLRNENKEDFLEDASIFYSDYLQLPQWLAAAAALPSPYNLEILFDKWKKEFERWEPEEEIWHQADQLVADIIDAAGLGDMKVDRNLEKRRVVKLSDNQKQRITAMIKAKADAEQKRVDQYTTGAGIKEGEVPFWSDKKIHKMFSATYYKKTLVKPKQGALITVAAPVNHKLLHVGFAKTNAPLRSMYPVDDRTWRIQFAADANADVELVLSVVEDPFDYYKIEVRTKSCGAGGNTCELTSQPEETVIGGGASSRSKLWKSGPITAPVTFPDNLDAAAGWFATGVDLETVSLLLLKLQTAKTPYFVLVRSQLTPYSYVYSRALSKFRDLEQSTVGGGSLRGNNNQQTEITEFNFVHGAQTQFTVNGQEHANIKLQWPDSLAKYANEEFGVYLNDIVTCISCKYYRIKEHHLEAYGTNWQPKSSVLAYSPDLPTFYTECGYKGDAFTLAASILTLGQDAWDNKVKSVKLPPGWRAQLFDDDNFASEVQELEESAECLYAGGAQSQVSSVKLFKKSFFSPAFEEQFPLVPVLYTETNYGGYKMELPASISKIPFSVQSDYLPGSYLMLSCTDTEFRGTCQPITASAAYLQTDQTLKLKGLPRSLKVSRIVGMKAVEQTGGDKVLIKGRFREPANFESPYERPPQGQTKLSYGMWFTSSGDKYTGSAEYRSREMVETFSPIKSWKQVDNPSRGTIGAYAYKTQCDKEVIGMYAIGYVWIPKFGQLKLKVNTDDASWIFINGRMEASDPCCGEKVHDLTHHPFINRNAWNKIYVVGADWCGDGKVEVNFDFTPILPPMEKPELPPANPLDKLTTKEWHVAQGVTYRGLNKAPTNYIEVFTYSPPSQWQVKSSVEPSVRVSTTGKTACNWAETIGIYAYSWTWVPSLPGKLTVTLETDDVSWFFINNQLIRNDKCCGKRTYTLSSKHVRKGAWNRIIGIGAEGCDAGALGISFNFEAQPIAVPPAGQLVMPTTTPSSSSKLVMSNWYTSIGNKSNRGGGKVPTSAQQVVDISPPASWQSIKGTPEEIKVTAKSSNRCNWINDVVGLYAVGFMYIPPNTEAVTMHVNTDDVSFVYINGNYVVGYPCCGWRKKRLDVTGTYLNLGAWNLVQVVVGEACTAGVLGIKFTTK